MNTQWIIRSATAEDAAGLQASMEAAYAVYQARMGGQRFPPMDVDYADEIRTYPVWVAQSEAGIAGGLVMVFDENRASLANICVSPDFQGQGLGRALMETAETAARGRGYTKLYLATHVKLTENVALYQHLGWVEYQRDETRIYMEKNL